MEAVVVWWKKCKKYWDVAGGKTFFPLRISTHVSTHSQYLLT